MKAEYALTEICQTAFAGESVAGEHVNAAAKVSEPSAAREVLSDDVSMRTGVLRVSRKRFVGFEVPIALDWEAELAAPACTITNSRFGRCRPLRFL